VNGASQPDLLFTSLQFQLLPLIDVARGHEVELGRHDADRLIRVVVHGDLAAQYIGGATIAPLPQPVADNGYPDAFQIFFFRKHSPDQRLYAQNAPEIRCRFAHRDLLGFGIGRGCRSPRLRGRNVRENRVVAPPLQPFRRRRLARLSLRTGRISVAYTTRHGRGVRTGAKLLGT